MGILGAFVAYHPLSKSCLTGISHINSQSSDYHPPSPLVRIIPPCHAVVKHPPSPPGRLERSLIRGCHQKLLSRAPCELLILKKANTSPFVTPPPRLSECPPSQESGITGLSAPGWQQTALWALPPQPIGRQSAEHDAQSGPPS